MPSATELTTPEVAALLGISTRTLYRYVQAGRKPPLDLRRQYETDTGERRLPSVRRGLSCYFQRRVVEGFAKRWGYELREKAPAAEPSAQAATTQRPAAEPA